MMETSLYLQINGVKEIVLEIMPFTTESQKRKINQIVKEYDNLNEKLKICSPNKELFKQFDNISNKLAKILCDGNLDQFGDLFAKT
jgi:hypothetical protein